MATASSCRVTFLLASKKLNQKGPAKVSCQVTQRARPALTIASEEMIGHFVRTAFERRRKVQATVSPYASNLLGYTRATTVGTMGCNTER